MDDVMTRVVQITLSDALMFPSGFLAPASYACVIFCRVPPGWIDGEGVRREGLEKIYEKMYGNNWREGNDDGSRYIVRSVEVRALSRADEEQGVWREVKNDDNNHYWFYHAEGGEELKEVEAGEL